MSYDYYIEKSTNGSVNVLSITGRCWQLDSRQYYSSELYDAIEMCTTSVYCCCVYSLLFS